MLSTHFKATSVTSSETIESPIDLVVEIETTKEMYEEYKKEMCAKEKTDTLESIQHVLTNFADEADVLKHLYLQSGGDACNTFKVENNKFLLKWFIDLVAASADRDADGVRTIKWIVEILRKQDKAFYLQDDVSILFNNIVSFSVKNNESELALDARNGQVDCLFLNTKKNGTIDKSILASLDGILSTHIKDYPEHTSQIYLNAADRLVENIASLKYNKKLISYVNDQFFLLTYFIDEAIEKAEDKNYIFELILESINGYSFKNLSAQQRKKLETLAATCHDKLFKPVKFTQDLKLFGNVDDKQKDHKDSPPLKKTEKTSIATMPALTPVAVATIPKLVTSTASEIKQPVNVSPKPVVNPPVATYPKTTMPLHQIEQIRRLQAQQMQVMQARQQAYFIQQKRIWFASQNAQKLQKFIDDTFRQLFILKNKIELQQLENHFKFLHFQLQHVPHWANQIIKILKAIDGQLLLFSPEQIKSENTNALVSKIGIYSNSVKSVISSAPVLYAGSKNDEWLLGP